jgi:hypothetical protein
MAGRLVLALDNSTSAIEALNSDKSSVNHHHQLTTDESAT